MHQRLAVPCGWLDRRDHVSERDNPDSASVTWGSEGLRLGSKSANSTMKRATSLGSVASIDGSPLRTRRSTASGARSAP